MNQENDKLYDNNEYLMSLVKELEQESSDEKPTETHYNNVLNRENETNIKDHIKTLTELDYVPNSPINDVIDSSKLPDFNNLMESYVKLKGIRLNEESMKGIDDEDRVKRIKSKIEGSDGRKLNLIKSDFIYYCDRCSSHGEVVKCLDIARDTYYKYMNQFLYPVMFETSPFIEGTRQHKMHQDKCIDEGRDPRYLTLREFYSIKWYGYMNVYDVKHNSELYDTIDKVDHHTGPKTFDGMINMYFPNYLVERRVELKDLYKSYREGDNKTEKDDILSNIKNQNNNNTLGTYEVIRRNYLKRVFTGETTGTDWKKIQQWVLDFDVLEKKCNKCNFTVNIDSKVNTTTHPHTKEQIYPLVLNFKDGNKENGVLTNLELLCYNCYFLHNDYDNYQHWNLRWRPLSLSDWVMRSMKLKTLKGNIRRRTRWIKEIANRLYTEDFIVKYLTNDVRDGWIHVDDIYDNEEQLDLIARKLMNDMYYYM